MIGFLSAKGKKMYILGIESSCDETAASVVEGADGKVNVRSNIVASQISMHREWGGVVPELAGRAHIECISRVVKEALDAAGVALSDIGAIAVTSNPGLIGALLIGVNFAKSLAFANNIPLVPVDHIKGHVAANYLTEAPPKPPFVSAVVSGGHTTLYMCESYTSYTELGSTLDDAAGEAFDKVGRVIGLKYPAGAEMDVLAKEGDKTAYKFPLPLAGKELDFSFSGLKTAALNCVHNASQKGEEINRADIAASFTHAVVSGICKRAGEAIERSGSKQLVFAGGVSANSHLRAGLKETCREHGAEFFCPPLSLCGDNGAMIAAQGYYEYLAGTRAGTELNAKPS